MALGVALWLCPKKNTQLYDKLGTLMSSLNTLFPGQPPRFEPHITITTNIQIDLEHPDQARDDVDRILSASAVALNSLPKNHSNLVTLGKIDSQRKFFKKLYFHVARDPNLVSFARIIRELFVILPSDIEQENIKQNPHLYTKDSHGNTIKRRKLKKHRDDPEPKQFDTSSIQLNATHKAAEWSSNEYDPHLSLVYSDIHPIDNALWRTIKTRVQDYLNIDNCDSEYLVDNGLGWDGGVLKLVLCEGDVNDWITLGSVDVH
ncbi:2, 3 cyclic phosphodiesterase [Suhomyces tanzawaensis NRRL Y-17324]|uniref:2',3'-cyclic-nucleotide 3'-phosphodiesterase n=1 Tax=Suhomyces tanzawaensis NRRL Y-17324 TaxID=984487 RepID=A0A1E4SKS5_9ASCO|nr:2, 3 cyclic phosphodiesterase [Suhomyces tanzawaensis NRRL Y-17324]ODV80106.1 2, 3 cyclic phosphodiesterase [Suhomyces tanzawaensis NRRL Y-17324]